MNPLRRWEAERPEPSEMQLFGDGQDLQATGEQAMADVILKCVYPGDRQ